LPRSKGSRSAIIQCDRLIPQKTHGPHQNLNSTKLPLLPVTETSERSANRGSTSASIISYEASAAVQNLLKSMQGTEIPGGRSQTFSGVSLTLLDLLPPSSTIPVIDAADESLIHNLLSQLPPDLLIYSQENDSSDLSNISPGRIKALLEAWSLEQKKDVLKRVLRSPHFSQSLLGLTSAIRDGGLPAISDALAIPVENNGYMRNSELAMSGSLAMEAFLTGVKTALKNESNKSQTNK
jgi:26S proteasome regulatory subunit N13